MRRVHGALLVALACAVLSGCSGIQPAPVVSEDQFRVTDDTAFATFVTPSTAEMDTGPGTRHSYMILISKTGNVTATKAEPMEVGKPIWIDDEVFFADRSYDYFVGATVHKVKHPKPALQEAITRSTTDGAVLLLSNHGFTETGYRMISSRITKDSYTDTDIEGIFHNVGECAGELYGQGEGTGPQLKILNNYPHTDTDSAIIFSQLTDRKYNKQILKGHKKPEEPPATAANLECREGALILLIDEETELGTFADKGKVRRWDTKTGKHHDVNLTTPSGAPFTFSNPETLTSALYLSSSSDEVIDWLALTGEIYRTTLKDGITTQTAKIDPIDLEDVATRTTSDNTYIYVIADHLDVPELRIYSRATGALIRTVQMPDLSKYITSWRTMWAIAPRPGYTP